MFLSLCGNKDDAHLAEVTPSVPLFQTCARTDTSADFIKLQNQEICLLYVDFFLFVHACLRKEAITL